MATHKSAEKRARQSLRKSTRNKSRKSDVKSWEKSLREAIIKKDAKSAQELLKTFMSRIDKASKKSIFHPQTAARKIARLSAQVSQILSK